MNDEVKRNAQQVVAVLVAAAAAIVAVGGGIVMAVLSYQEKPIPDQLDKYAGMALIAMLGLLAKLGDSRAEAKDAAKALANDLTKLAEVPKEVTGVGGDPVRVAEVPPAPQPAHGAVPAPPP